MVKTSFWSGLLKATVVAALIGWGTSPQAIGLITQSGARYVPSEASSGVFFEPDIDAATTILDMFDARNGTPAATISTDYALPGQTKSVKMVYNADEDGDDLILEGESIGGQFVASTTLFARSYERFEGPWEENWPQGLKTMRLFTTPDLTGCQDAPNNYAYVSEKIIYPGYDTSPDPRLLDYVTEGSWAYCDPVGGRPEIPSVYTAGQLFGNGMPYLRTGHWYKFERWYVLNSAPDAADGIIRIWIDDVLVLDRTNVVFRATSPSIIGTEWRAMWFGGNYSNTGTFTAPSSLLRYLSGFHVSTTLDR